MAAATVQVKAGPSEWVDAQEMHRSHPATFHAPSAQQIREIEVGVAIKICNGEERFWTQVVSVKRKGKDPFRWLITAVVDNKLIGEVDYDCGDLVQFEGRHVYDIDEVDEVDETDEVDEDDESMRALE